MVTAEANREKTIIGTGAVTFADGHRETLHVHAEHGQLKWPSTGVASVRTPDGVFVAASTHAVWIPAAQRHGGIYAGEVHEQNLYVREPYCSRLPRRCCLIEVSPRLAETVTRAVTRRSGYGNPSRAEDEAVLRVLEQEAADSGRAPLLLTLPESSSLAPVLDGLLRAPNDRRPLAAWSLRLGMAERSLRRAFIKETGLSFAEWRKRVRVLSALQRLSVGSEVSTIAGALGYESKSAFVYMFRTTLGITPARYYRRGPAAVAQR